MDLFSGSIKYVIDTNSLIDLQRWFRPAIAAGAWEKLEQLAGDRILVSVDEVLEELRFQDDEVFRWANGHKEMFLPLVPDIQTAAKSILASHRELVDYKKRRSSADPFLIAAAQLLDAVVVTEERRAGKGERPKIPNVCSDLGITCIGVVDMFEREGLQLVIAPSAED